MHAIAVDGSNVIRDCALVIGQKTRSEDGVKDAVMLIEIYTTEFHSNVNHGFKK